MRDRHQPSAHRQLLRDIARLPPGGDPSPLVEAARRLRDAYFRALGLLHVAGLQAVGTDEAAALAREAVAAALDVDRPWRRGEVLGALLKDLATWRPWDRGSGRVRAEAARRAVDDVVAMDPEQGKSEAIHHVAPHVDAGGRARLITTALLNRGFELQDGKAVLRAAAAAHDPPGPLADTTLQVEDDVLSARLTAYLHRELVEAGTHRESDLLASAWARAARVPDDGERVEVLHYVIQCAGDLAGLERLHALALAVPAVPERARLLAALGAAADRARAGRIANAWLREAAATAQDVTDAAERAAIRTTTAAGLRHAGLLEEADAAFTSAWEDAGLVDEPVRTRLQARIRETMERFGMQPPEDAAPAPERTPAPPTAGPARGGHVLALYDTYEGGLAPVHARAVARAAPLCAAFGLDLALVGFPVDDLDRLAAYVARETNIGEGGRHVEALHKEGRIHLVAATEREPPRDWGPLGLPVATTPSPAAGKATSWDALRRALAAEDGPSRVCLVMGLGRRGLPASLLQTLDHHVEVTGSRVSLETATAMGIIAYALAQELPAPHGASG